MANPEHVAILRQGVETWNEWRRRNRHLNIVPDLAGANLSNTPLFDAALNGAILDGADFTRAGLIGANLRGAKLRGAKLAQCHFPTANLCNADLTGADLTRALFGATILGETILRDTVGLKTCLHHGRSILDFATVVLSGGLPEAFLRGCGLPEVLIENLRSLHGVQFYSCFISHSTDDHEFADRLHTDLQDNGVRCWFAPRDIRGGRKLHQQIDDAIRLHDRLLLILSEHSMNSEWVKTEIAYARQKELNEGRQVLFPISLVPFPKIRDWKCFDADTRKDSAREIREYFIPDFSNWKNQDSYQQAFQRLVRDLKADAGQK